MAAPDPNLFRVDWEQTGEVLAMIVVLAFLVERALALVFESKIYIQIVKAPIKELITFVVCFMICWVWSFDALSVVLHGDKLTIIGRAVTALVIAGGSKASLKLFRDIMGIETEQSQIARGAKAPKPPAPPLAKGAGAD
ncbi:MAG TPA: hypothetical protein VFP11_08480 [Candidatus Angelobacter sp.]|nr:hypothetical protein [Candidatus Angelobacter sp.]